MEKAIKAIILSSYLASLYTNRQLIRLSQKVDHTNEVILNIELLNGAVKDVESATRGYVLSRNISFFSPFYGRRHLTDSLTARLRVLLADNDIQSGRLGTLKNLIDERVHIAEFAIRDFEANGMVLTDSMKSLQPEVLGIMQGIRNTSRTMQAEEKRLLDERAGRLQKTFDLIDIINFIALIMAFFLFIFGLFTYTKENKARRAALQRINGFQDELKKRVNDLDRANKELIHMRSLEKFTATGRIARTIAHEVRNPLTNINLATNQLRTEMGEKAAENDMYLEMIERNSERINQLISNLLNATKFSELNFKPVPVQHILDTALHEADDRIKMRNISIVKKYAGGSCKVSADADKLKIAFLNIIINAVEALAAAQKPGQIIIKTSVESGKCRIDFEDNGPGMDDETLQKIFEPYYTSKPHGNGLGLTNTQNIILNHKGDISVSSSRGKGTTVTILLDFA